MKRGRVGACALAVLVACASPNEGTSEAGPVTGAESVSTTDPSGTSGASTSEGSTNEAPAESSGASTGEDTPQDLGGSPDVPPEEEPAAAMRFGLAVNPDSSPEQLDSVFAHYEEIGVDQIWLTAAMEWLCYQGSTCDFTPLDGVVQRAKDRGWTVALQVHGTPEWLDARGMWFGPDTDERREAWVDLFAQLVARYGADVDHYEVWNEPNIEEFWSQGPDATAYAMLLHDAYEAAKAIDPQVTIVGGNLSQNDLGFLGLVYDAMENAYGPDDAAANRWWFDVLGVHPYAGDASGGYAPGDDSHPDVITMYGPKDPDYLGYRRMRDLVTEREGEPKDLAFGEMGYDTDGDWFSVAEADRAQYIYDALVLARDDGFVRYVAWFTHDGTWFGIHGTSTETGFTDAALAP